MIPRPKILYQSADITLSMIRWVVKQNFTPGTERQQLSPKNSVFGGNQTANDTIVRLGDAIKLIGR